MSNKNAIINTLRKIDTYEDLQVAVETLESVVWNFENSQCPCDFMRDAAPAETTQFSRAASALAKALKLMNE
jgi:hypothetical protein